MKSKSKYLAIISLVVMGLGFIITTQLPPTLISGVLHSGFEAGVVGGLADWFAVTALFRHPLGLPIPHTGLLPKNREKITKGIIFMLENDWLSKASVSEKLNNKLSTKKILHMVETEIHSVKIKNQIATFLIELIKLINEEKLANRIATELKTYLLNIDTQKVINPFLNHLLQNHYEEKSFDFILMKLKEWLGKEENRNKISSATHKGLTGLKLDGLMQFALQSLLNMMSEERMGQIISNILVKAVENLQTKDNDLRSDLILLLREELNDLAINPKVIQELENWKVQLIRHEDLAQATSLFLRNIKDKWLNMLQDSQNVDQYIIPYVTQLIHAITSNSDLLNKLDQGIQNKVNEFVDKNHKRIGEMVKENLDKLDDQMLTSTIEERVGKDLQWIRVNGAVCGFVIGIVLSFF
jgi:uncharacterized membrane-anchored protein YjiN (DUF445 family)